MPFATIQPAFAAGEISPSLFGRVDLAKTHIAATTMRNFFVSYRGGASTRAGTAFVGNSRTSASASSLPPRLIKFQFNINQGYALEFGNQYMRVISNGGLVTSTASAITGITQANPAVVSSTASVAVGDDVFISGVSGMTQVNGRTFKVGTTGSGTFQLKDEFTTASINSTTYSAYTSGGTVAPIFVLTTPYAIADLPQIKFTQSADKMTLCHPSYAPADLTRTGTASWTLTTTSFTSSIAPPTTASATASNTTGTSATSYQYVVTAVASTSREESVASPIANVTNSVDIATVAGTITVNWSAVTGATSYNIYKAPAAYNTTIPVGVLFGYAGTALSTSFLDTNITQDFSFVPPLHENPFSGSGNSPSCPAYFQQRRFYANTNNNPDTYYASEPGAFTNMDSRIPTNDADAIIGTPWAQQVNGIQFMVPMPRGLVILTGGGAWQLSGATAVTPSNQPVQPQAYNGCSQRVPPITINYDILYVQAKGSIVRDLSYNFFADIYTGTDLTVLSSHLFTGLQILEWAWAEEPYKIIWAVRSDGILLSLTYLKEQDVYAWARHDTDGLFQSVCSVTEPPVDAVYAVVKRLVNGTWRYYIERMDDRLWTGVEDCWCVDAGLSYPMSSPSATLTASSATGDALMGTPLLIDGGTGYASPSVSVDDPTGTGATFTATVSSGIITNIAVLTSGSDYSAPTLRIDDTSGSGAVGQAVIINPVLFTATSSVFTASDVGSVIRMGGGIANITTYSSGTIVTANIIQPITTVIPDDPGNTPVPAASGSWTMSAPTLTVSNLDHLEGKLVSILADGNVEAPQTVSAGSITLSISASSITIGEPFLAQLQDPYLDIPGGPTVQGKRKNIYAVTVRVANTRGIEVGSNQVDSSTQPNNAIQTWTNLIEIPQRTNAIYAGTPIPLYTGDLRIPIKGDWQKHGQVAIQQRFPLPADVLALIPESAIGDSSG